MSLDRIQSPESHQAPLCNSHLDFHVSLAPSMPGPRPTIHKALSPLNCPSWSPMWQENPRGPWPSKDYISQPSLQQDVAM